MKKLQTVLLVVLLAMALLIGGCSNPPDTIPGEINLLVTRDFGEEDIFDEIIQLEVQTSVMDLLNQHLDIETEYGGGFVNGINGLISGYTNTAEKEKSDWFYFINGIMTSVGATEYFPTDQDSIWWDYHSWGDIPFTPAVIGAFPQPFLNGYQGKNPGTLILAGKDCEALADSLEGYLKQAGVEDVEVQAYQETLAANREKMIIVLALWEELSKSSFWQGVQDHRDKTGWFAELSEEAFYSLNIKGEQQTSYSQEVGAILSTATGMGDATPLWLLTALDMEGMRNVMDVLVKDEDKIAKKFGVLVTNSEVIGLPVQE
ncbi:DUF4430 domain-containing protein [Clostridium formicaceticum]|uniref:Transcobalamin-like C-terminal domain-containing protein n=1 Tax=Clostridium formicaceticum TaxID=1497 RepID=A0AAC9RMD1_9CLOT|nr:DUF4430 domain-containing protein [Clostridium formicaceticum]AOY77662.1 hypothetical protein BJL90_18445 [Clostridium formicaceticum]ARE88247.1 hypothetical protein CLFO_26480 [Clostridium formicaceticum]